MSFLRYFRDDEAAAEAVAMETARLIIEWVGQKYHAKFLDWLDEQASRPFVVSNDPSVMIQSVVRANTLREIKAHLVKIEKAASAAVRQEEP